MGLKVVRLWKLGNKELKTKYRLMDQIEKISTESILTKHNIMIKLSNYWTLSTLEL